MQAVPRPAPQASVPRRSLRDDAHRVLSQVLTEEVAEPTNNRVVNPQPLLRPATLSSKCIQLVNSLQHNCFTLRIYKCSGLDPAAYTPRSTFVPTTQNERIIYEAWHEDSEE